MKLSELKSQNGEIVKVSQLVNMTNAQKAAYNDSLTQGRVNPLIANLESKRQKRKIDNVYNTVGYELDKGKAGYEQYIQDTTVGKSIKQQNTQNFDNPASQVGNFIGGLISGQNTLDNKVHMAHTPNNDWTDEQKYRFGYLYTQDKDKANEFAKNVNEAISYQKSEKQNKKFDEKYKNLKDYESTKAYLEGDTYNQAEKYGAISQEERAYLRNKKLNFSSIEQLEKELASLNPEEIESQYFAYSQSKNAAQGGNKQVKDNFQENKELENKMNEINFLKTAIAKKKQEEAFNNTYGNIEIPKDFQPIINDKEDDVVYREINGLKQKALGMVRISKDFNLAKKLDAISEMEDNEKLLYNYIAEEKSIDEANKYFSDLVDLELDKRYNDKLMQDAIDYSSQNAATGVIGTLARVPLNLASGAEFAGNVLSGNADKRSTLATVSQGLGQGTKSQWEYSQGAKVFDFLYDTAASGVDSVAALGLNALTGGTVGTLALAGSAAASTANDLIDRGANNAQIIFGSIGAGIAEYAFENLSLEQLKAFKGKNIAKVLAEKGGKGVALEVVKSIATNASEELNTELANIIVDNILMGNLSNYKTKVFDYYQEGMSLEEAKQKAAEDLGKQVALAAGSGALMGFAFGSVGSVAGTIKANYNAKTIGDNITQYKNGVTDLQILADSVPNLSKTIVEKINALDSKSNAVEVGLLANAVNVQVAENAQAQLTSALEKTDLSKRQIEATVNQMIGVAVEYAATETTEGNLSNRIALLSNNKNTETVFKDFFNNGMYGGNAIKTLSKLSYKQATGKNHVNYQPTQENANLSNIEDDTNISQDVGYEVGENTSSPFAEPKLETPIQTLNNGETIDNLTTRPTISNDTQTRIKNIFKSMGIDVDFDFTGDGDGKIVGNKISISKYCKDPIRFVMKHEFFHYLTNGKNFKGFKTYLLNDSVVFDKWLTEASENKPAYETLQDAVDDYSQRYENLDRDAIIEEVMCDFFGDVVFVKDTDLNIDAENTIAEDFLSELRQKDRSLFERFIDAIKRFFAQFKQTAYEKDMAYLENRIIRLKETVDKKQVESDETVKNYISQTETRKSLTVDSEGNALTESQQEYFKDSKVRDKNGNLMVVYHGTDAEFNKFSKDTTGIGYWFTEEKSYANQFGKKIKQVYLNSTKPLDIDTEEGDDTLAKVKKDLYGENADERSLFSPLTKEELIRLGYDGLMWEHSGKKTIVIFNSNQAKLTTNENPTESDDIRYSKPRQANPNFANMTTSEIVKAVNNGGLSVEDAIKGVKDAQNEKINSLSKRINKIKTRLDIEKGISGEPIFVEKDLKKIAKKLKSDFNSVLKTDELVEALRDFYSFIYTSKNLTQEDINEQAGKIAQDIIDERRKTFKRDDVSQRFIDYIKDLNINLSKTDIGEMAYDYGSLGEFKKRFHKVLHINENSTDTIDSFWSEIVDEFSSVLPSKLNKEVNEGDKLRNLIEAYKVARDGAEDIKEFDEYYKADMIDALTESIYEGYYDVGTRTPNRTKIEAALQRQKIRNQKTRERRDEIINRYQLAREKGIEGRAKTRLRNSLENKRNRMRSIFEHGTKQRNVKAELQPFINDVLKFSEKLFVEENAVNIQQELKTLAADYYSALKNTPYFEEFVYERLINEGNNFGEISQELEQGGIYKTNIYKLSKTQLDKLNKIFAMINKQVTNSNDLFRGSIRQNTQEAVTNIESEVGKTHREFKGWVNFAKALPLSTLTPETLVDSIGSPTLKKYFTLLVKGELESGKDSRKAKNKLDEITNKYDFNIKKEKLDKPNYEIKLSNDKTYKFTLNQLLSFYALSKRQQALQHILSKDGGIRITTTSKVVKELKNQDIVLTQDDVTKINNLLTNKQKKMVDELQSYLTSLGEKGNEVSRALWGVDIFNEDVYFPIVVVDPKIRDIEGQKTQKTVSKKIKNHSSTKETNENANGQILVGDFFDIWTSHCEQMAQFNNKVLPIENIERIMRELGANANKVLGSETTKYIEKLIDDYNGYSKQKHAADAILGKGISVYKGVRVGLSITSAAKQYGAIVRAMEFINPKYFVGKPINVKKSWNELIEYSGAAVLKDKGGMDIGSNKSSYKWYVDKIAYRDVTGFMAEAMDKVGWATIWEAVKKEVASNNPSLEVNSQEFLDKCGERFDEIAFKTQVYDSVLKRSGLQRSDSDAMKSSVAFMGEPTTIYNSLIKAILKYKETHDVKHTVNAFSKSVISIFASQLVTAFSYGLIKSLMIQYDEDDEDKRSYLEDVLTISLQSFVDETNPLTMIPLVKDIVEYSRGYSNERMETASIGNLIKAINKWVTASEKGEADFDSFADTFISALELVGIPANNARNIGKALYGAVTKPFDEKKPVDIAGAIRQGVTGESKETRLYKAIINGDTEAVKEFERRYGDTTKYNNALVKGLAENDKRIKKALKASKEGNIAEYNSIVSELISEGNFDVDTIFKAVNKVDVSKETEETQYEEYDNFGNVSIPQNIQNEFAKIYISTGSLPTPSKASSKFMVDGEEITLTPEQYSQYAKSRGQKSVEYADDVIGNSYYNKLTDEEKLKAFSKVYSYATALAKTEVSDYELDGANETCYNLNSKNNISISTYWIAKVLISGDNADINNDGKVTNNEKKRTLTNNGFSSSEANKIIKGNKN